MAAPGLNLTAQLSTDSGATWSPPVWADELQGQVSWGPALSLCYRFSGKNPGIWVKLQSVSGAQPGDVARLQAALATSSQQPGVFYYPVGGGDGSQWNNFVSGLPAGFVGRAPNDVQVYVFKAGRIIVSQQPQSPLYHP